ncbi:hypothetical protein GEMRC1_004018 [Eukaryota sp. GEM-RC1]
MGFDYSHVLNGHEILSSKIQASPDTKARAMSCLLLHGLTQNDIAFFYHVSQSTISRWKTEMMSDTDDEIVCTRTSRILTEVQVKTVVDWVIDNPHIYLRELQQYIYSTFDILISKSTASKDHN